MKPLLGPLLGGLSHNSAKIWARADAPAKMHVWLAQKEGLIDAQYLGAADLPAVDGCAGVFRLIKLKPETQYFYAVGLKKTRPPKNEFHAFTTFPKPGVRKNFNFMFGSCYRPEDEHGGETFDHLRDVIKNEKKEEAPRFGLFLGDQIYADAAKYNGLGRVAITLDDFRKAYAHNWSRQAMRDFLPTLPLFMTIDDHEVDDDWRWRDSSLQWADISILKKTTRFINRRPPQERHLYADRVRAALKSCDEHQFMHAPTPLLPFETDEGGQLILHPQHPASFAYTFVHGGAAFFVLDTRSMRVNQRGKKTMLGHGQWTMLEQWLRDVKDKYKVKFIVSSCSLLPPFFFDIANDRWSGFPKEQQRLLEFLAVNEIEGVRILTGDLHSGHAVTAQLKCPSGKRIPIAEFCASPFEQESIWISFGYFPLLSKWLTGQKRHFYRAFRNFGIVNVDFASPEPKVTFTLHYKNKDWKTVSITA